MDDAAHGDNFTTCKMCGAVIGAYKAYCPDCVLDLNNKWRPMMQFLLVYAEATYTDYDNYELNAANRPFSEGGAAEALKAIGWADDKKSPAIPLILEWEKNANTGDILHVPMNGSVVVSIMLMCFGAAAPVFQRIQKVVEQRMVLQDVEVLKTVPEITKKVGKK